MKTKLSIVAAMALLLTGCMSPDWQRLIPENKSAHIMIYNPVYGYVTIDTRVVGDTNNGLLYPLPAPPAPPTIR